MDIKKLVLAVVIGGVTTTAMAVDKNAVRTQAKMMHGPIPATMPGAEADSPALIDLGERLYFETALSADGTQSCNTCHRIDGGRGGVDNEATSLGVKGGRGDRNSPSVWNAGFHVAQFWDGRAADLAAQAKGPILNPVEMAVPDEQTALPCNHVWDFGSDISSAAAVDRGPASRHCRIVNLPTRAVCGRKWDGTVHDWTVDSSHYGALHFHSNAIADAEWEPFATWTVPADLPSGLYAAKLVQGESDDYVPFYILPPKDAEKPAIAFLAPTASYLAYANFCIQPQFAALYPQMREDTEGDALLRALT